MSERRYFSYMRTGLRSGLQEGLSATAALTLKSTDGAQTVDATLTIAGPETMRGLAPSAIKAQYPPARSTDMRAGSLPYISFHDPALPWLLSFESLEADGRQPFIGLIAVPEAKVQMDLAAQPVARAIIADLDHGLPAVSAFRLCAHVEDTIPAEGPNAAPSQQAFSRLICPQNLSAGVPHLAMVVPLYASGAQAALGMSAPAQAAAPAWAPGATSVTLPVYAHWSFTPGPGRGAEDILRDLEAVPPAGDLADIGVDPARSFASQGVNLERVSKRAILAAAPPEPDQNSTILAALSKTTAGGDQQLPLPTYGGMYGTAQIDDVAAPDWLKDINLDPGLRTMAGQGTALMQRHQDEVIAFVREDAGQFEAANGVLARAHGAMSVTRRRVADLVTADLDVLCRLVGPAADRIKVGSGSDTQTLAQRLKGSLEGALAKSTVRRSMAAGGRSLVGRTPDAGSSMIDGLTEAARTVRTPSALPGSSVLGNAFDRIQSQNPKVAMVAPDVDVDQLLSEMSDQFTANGVVIDSEADLGRDAWSRDKQRPDKQVIPKRKNQSLRDVILKALDPDRAVTPRIQARIEGADLSDPLPRRIVLDPVWPKPILPDLLEHAPELISPSLADLPPDGIMALSFDTSAIAALVAGANHELLREMRWRGLPLSTKPSPIRRVFPAPLGAGDPLPPDVPPIVEWRGGAQEAFGTTGPGLVILIRSALFRRFPETLITLRRAKWQGDLRTVDGTSTIAPIATGNVGPDALYFAFPVSASDMRGDADPTVDKPGGFMVFEQPQGGLSFGLNHTASDGASWNALSWEDLSEPHVTGTAFSGTREPGALAWGANSATMATILQERPVVLSIHVSDMIEGGA